MIHERPDIAIGVMRVLAQRLADMNPTEAETPSA
jgi:hypothetical protein